MSYAGYSAQCSWVVFLGNGGIFWDYGFVSDISRGPWGVVASLIPKRPSGLFIYLSSLLRSCDESLCSFVSVSARKKQRIRTISIVLIRSSVGEEREKKGSPKPKDLIRIFIISSMDSAKGTCRQQPNPVIKKRAIEAN